MGEEAVLCSPGSVAILRDKPVRVDSQCVIRCEENQQSDEPNQSWLIRPSSPGNENRAHLLATRKPIHARTLWDYCLGGRPIWDLEMEARTSGILPCCHLE